MFHSFSFALRSFYVGLVHGNCNVTTLWFCTCHIWTKKMMLPVHTEATVLWYTLMERTRYVSWHGNVIDQYASNRKDIARYVMCCISSFVCISLYYIYFVAVSALGSYNTKGPCTTFIRRAVSSRIYSSSTFLYLYVRSRVHSLAQNVRIHLIEF